MRKTSPDIVAKSTSVHEESCNGCKRTGSQVMLSVMTSREDFVDIFLSEEQALQVAEQLQTLVKSDGPHARSFRGPRNAMRITIGKDSRVASICYFPLKEKK